MHFLIIFGKKKKAKNSENPKFMKKFRRLGIFLLSLIVCLQIEDTSQVLLFSEKASAISQSIVISQFYGGGGVSSSSPYSNDFVELFNRSSQPVSLNGWSVQYASATGTNWLVTPLPNVTLQPGQYFLIQYASNNSGGASLPSPDFIAPPVTVGSNTFIPNLSSTTGKLALVSSANQLPASSCPNDPSIVDLVGYGTSASCYEGARTQNLSATTAGIRNGGGCVDTDSNSSDFTISSPNPRNTSSPLNPCNLGSTLQAGGSVMPSTTAPGGVVLFTVTVIPATSPPSTGISVRADLTTIGGSVNQQFFDDGTNGDTTAGDNIFSLQYLIPSNSTGGFRNITVSASDAQGRVASIVISLNISAPPAGDDPLILGNPSDATADVSNENNYLMIKPQYSLSYNRSRATPNWVAWRLDQSWLGSAPRQDDYRPDPDLPAGWYQVTSEDYSGSGYDRGHMCPSGDRTRSVTDNSATFLMTNFLPQLPANNQGPWEDFESYCRALANQGFELYIFAGGYGNAGTIAQGRIVVPQYTWKVVLVLPNGDNDLQRINKSTRTIAILVPNQPPLNQNAPWRQFRVSVKYIEALTGLNFFSRVPKNTREIIKRRRDNQ
jgi:endonuclease G